MLILRRRIQEEDASPYAIQSYDATLPNYNTIAMAVMYNAGLSSLQDRMTKQEAESVTDATMPSFANQRTMEEFDEFQYFTNVTTTRNNMFYNNYALKSVTLPPSLTILGQSSFGYCRSLKSVDISNVTTIGNNCFYFGNDLSSVLEEITVSPNLTTIPQQCFYRCVSLKKINNFNAKTIGNQAFRDCWVLDNINLVDIQMTTYETSRPTFQNCYELSGTMKFAEGFNGRFGNSTCLQNCRSITHLDMPSTWTYGFENTNNASGMDSLIDITLRRVTPPNNFTHNFAQFPSTTIFYVPATSVNSYKTKFPDYASRFFAIP